MSGDVLKTRLVVRYRWFRKPLRVLQVCETSYVLDRLTNETAPRTWWRDAQPDDLLAQPVWQADKPNGYW